MPYRIIPFENNSYYHIYNRGLNKQQTFATPRDYNHFIKALFYYRLQSPKPKFSLYRQSQLFKIDSSKKTVDIICYCLMPNHFHLIIRQLQENGISEFMRRFTHSYTKYWNTKNNKQGPLFQGMFKAILVESDEQLLHLSRYIHLNPLVSGIVKNLQDYRWSSYLSYLDNTNYLGLAKEDILAFFKSYQDYEKFVLDQADYGTTLELIKHEAFDSKE